MLTALLSEIGLHENYLENESIETIYFGGGTPSLLSIDEIKSLVNEVKKKFSTITTAEISLEVNPDDITEEKLQGWKSIGITRLSIGIQSFFNEDLLWMNRAHNAEQANKSLELSTKHFENISIDLIYGTPLLTNEKWKYNVEKAVAFHSPHLSCYALTVEPKTPLAKMIRQNQTKNIDSAKQAEQFLLLMEWAEKAGYEQYEISNFAKPGYRSRHNSSYWQGKKYLGIGPSAHSYDGVSRQWNVSNNHIYIESIQKKIIPAEKEILSHKQKLNEYIMTSLRTKEGLSLKTISEDESLILKKQSKKFLERNLLSEANDHLILTNKGKLFADGIAADLFFTDKE